MDNGIGRLVQEKDVAQKYQKKENYTKVFGSEARLKVEEGSFIQTDLFMKATTTMDEQMVTVSLL